MSGSLALLLIFLLVFVLGMRAALSAQKKAQARAKEPARPLPPPAKGFSKDSYGCFKGGAVGLGTLAVTGYVAYSTVMKTNEALAADIDATEPNPHSGNSTSDGTELSDGFDDSFGDSW